MSGLWAIAATRSEHLLLLKKAAPAIALALGAVVAFRLALQPILRDSLPFTPFLAAVVYAASRHGAASGLATMLLAIPLGASLFAPSATGRPFELGILVATFAACSLFVVALLQRDRDTRTELSTTNALLQKNLADRERLAEQLEQARRLENLGRLAGGVAHDFNNLLTVIQGSSALATRELPPSRFLESIEAAAVRASELTKQLLALGRRQPLLLHPVEVAQSLQECIRICKPTLPSTITLELASNGAGFVEGDSTALQQILLNLVANARDAMPSGGIVRLGASIVEVDAKNGPSDLSPGPYVRFAVTDTGEGISESVRSRLFEPFFSTKQSGTGLGLAVVYRLAKQLRGTVQASSDAKGTCFHVYLPRARQGSSRASALNLVSLPKRRVLLVEDNALVRNVLQSLLASHGHTVEVVDDGLKALACLQTDVFDVLLSDVVLPEMDGIALADTLRDKQNPIAIVLMSGYSDEATWGRLTQLNVSFLLKPFSEEDILVLLDDACRKATRPTRACRGNDSDRPGPLGARLGAGEGNTYDR